MLFTPRSTCRPGAPSAPSRVLLVGNPTSFQRSRRSRAAEGPLYGLDSLVGDRHPKSSAGVADGYTVHTFNAGDRALDALISRADAIIATPTALSPPALSASTEPHNHWGATDYPPARHEGLFPDDPRFYNSAISL